MTWKQATIDREKMRFDEAADIYDRYRPGYPTEIVHAVCQLTEKTHKPKVIEIGAGSGKATASFADLGLDITCIEPGQSLAAKGRERFASYHGVTYINATFEDTELAENTYDLIYSAQAFHWVRKPYGYSKMARLLKSGGHSALFWNRYLDDGSKTSSQVAELCDRYHLLPMVTLDRINVINDHQFRELNQCGFFGDVKLIKLPWSRMVTFDDFLNFLQTGNGWMGLEDSDKASCGRELEALFNEAGGIFQQNFICSLFVAKVI